MFGRRAWSWLLMLSVSAGGRVPVAAQNAEAPPRFQEAVSLETDLAAAKKFRAVEDYLAEQQWSRAIDVLGEITKTGQQTLVAVSPGHYVNVAFYANVVLSQLPPQGLAVYRARVDPQARQRLEAAKTKHDASLLRNLLRDALASSYGDEALLLLGEWAWERGDIDAARSYWELIGFEQTSTASKQRLPMLRYPNSDIDAALVQARLILCTLMAGDFERADRERAEFRRRFADAEGELAGRRGKLPNLLDTIASAARRWQFPAPDAAASTFALNAGRNKIMPKDVDVGAELWSVRCSSEAGTHYRYQSRQPAFGHHAALSYCPVVYGDVVLLNDSDRIDAYNLRTGRPAWPVDENGTAAIYPAVPDEFFPVSGRDAVGVPRYTMTLFDGKLYAKMGTPITSRQADKRGLPAPNSDLVCLDVHPKRGQGKLVWKISADDIERGATWAFEGTPVAGGGRVFVALRRSEQQTQTNVACFDSETGRLIWNRKVCAAVSDVGRWRNFISHQLLTLGAGSVFYSTDLGAIAALDAEDGTIRWVVTYQSHQPDSPAELSDHTKQGLLPCLYHRGLVIAAPNDSSQIMAIDARSGLVRWRQTLKDRIRHLLGVGQGNLILSGNSLWALDLETGRRVWGREIIDPEFFGYGRGLLVGDAVWWPTRETIEIRSQQTGRPLRRKPIVLRTKGTSGARNSGGNLVITDGYLLVAQSDRLVAYGEHALPVKRSGAVISANALPSRLNGQRAGGEPKGRPISMVRHMTRQEHGP